MSAASPLWRCSPCWTWWTGEGWNCRHQAPKAKRRSGQHVRAIPPDCLSSGESGSRRGSPPRPTGGRRCGSAREVLPGRWRTAAGSGFSTSRRWAGDIVVRLLRLFRLGYRLARRVTRGGAREWSRYARSARRQWGLCWREPRSSRPSPSERCLLETHRICYPLRSEIAGEQMPDRDHYGISKSERPRKFEDARNRLERQWILETAVLISRGRLRSPYTSALENCPSLGSARLTRSCSQALARAWMDFLDQRELRCWPRSWIRESRYTSRSPCYCSRSASLDHWRGFSP